MDIIITISTQIVGTFLEPTGMKFFTVEPLNTSYLNDISITSALNNQVLQYNSSSSKWVNAAISSGSSTLSSLTDCNISTPFIRQFVII